MRSQPPKSVMCIVIAVMMAAATGSGSETSLPSSGFNKMTVTAPLLLKDKQSLVLRGLKITSSPENCISLHNCTDIIIEQCELGAADGEGVSINSCRNITIRDCRFRDVRSGVYAVISQNIAVESCAFQNVRGPMPRGQAVQFDKVSGGGNRIISNTCVNEPGKSNPEDAISIYKSSGLADEPLLVAGNKITGGGPSPSGGGIMLGDSGGSHILVENNVLTDPGQYGIAVAGGTSITLLSNTIYGRSQPFTNVGLYVWNQDGESCGHITVRGNRVMWFRKDGERNGAWNSGNCGSIAGWNDNDWNAHLSE
jgi:hypothetical protein